MDLLRKRMSEMSDKDYDDEAYNRDTNMTDKGNSNGHGSDLYKLPNHPTFSQDSLLSNPLQSGGVWSSSGFTPSEHNLRNMSPEALQRYFNEVEVEHDENGNPVKNKYGQPKVVDLNLPNNLRFSKIRSAISKK